MEWPCLKISQYRGMGLWDIWWLMIMIYDHIDNDDDDDGDDDDDDDDDGCDDDDIQMIKI